MFARPDGQSRYYSRKEKGLCVTCGKEAAAPSKTQCDKCRLRNGRFSAVSREKSKKKNADSGMCIKCGEFRPVSGRAKCENCLVKLREITRNRVAKRISNGDCPSCGKEKTNGMWYCDSCREKYRGYERISYRKRVDDGLCTICGGERDVGGKICSGCRNSAKLRRREYVRECYRNGVCLRCKSEAVTMGKRSYCLACWIKSICRLATKSEEIWEQLLELWVSQNGKCAYTGTTLFPGSNASLDHKMPVTRGGNNDIENFQWVAFKVNTMKSNHTHQEFIDLCKRISDKFHDELS